MGVQNNDHKEENELQPHFLFLLEHKSLNMYVCLLVYLTVEVTPGYNGPSEGAEAGAAACGGGSQRQRGGSGTDSSQIAGLLRSYSLLSGLAVLSGMDPAFLPGTGSVKWKVFMC